MTSISSGNAALTILQQVQPSLLQASEGKSASDTILDIVSNRSAASTKAAAASSGAAAKAQPEATQSPREAGGTVSSEISSVQWSALNAAAVSQLNSAESDPLIAFKPTETSAENAEIFVGRLADTLAKYNAQFDLKEIPSREDFMAGKDAWLAREIKSGASEKQIQGGLAMNFGEGGYERNFRWTNEQNDNTLRQAKTSAGSIGNFTTLLGQVFGKEVAISKDQDGRLTLGALDMSYGNGQKMLSYGEDGSLTTFNEDGSTKRTLAAKDLSRL